MPRRAQPDLVRFNLMLPLDLKTRIDACAVAERRPTAEVMRAAMEAYLAADGYIAEAHAQEPPVRPQPAPDPELGAPVADDRPIALVPESRSHSPFFKGATVEDAPPFIDPEATDTLAGPEPGLGSPDMGPRPHVALPPTRSR